MSVEIIIIRKNISEQKLRYAIEFLSSRVSVQDERIMITPATGKMIEFLHFLRDNNIPYETSTAGQPGRPSR